MEEQFISYESSLKLRNLGFDEDCFGYYVGKDRRVFLLDDVDVPSTSNFKLSSKISFRAPLWQQAFDWFCEKYRLSGTVQYFLNDYWCYTINDMKNIHESNRLFTEFKTKEEARLKLLEKLIETVENK